MTSAPSHPSGRSTDAFGARPGRGRFFALWAGALLTLTVAGGTGLAAEPAGDTSTAGIPPAAETRPVAVDHIYFADRSGRYLQAEERFFTGPERGPERGRTIVEALIKGPRSGLMRTLPAGTRLRGFYLASGKRAYVDFSESIAEQHPGGCRTELLTLYSIVNSLVLNMPEVSTVKILVGGRDVSTLAGHIDIRQPFTADMSLIR